MRCCHRWTGSRSATRPSPATSSPMTPIPWPAPPRAMVTPLGAMGRHSARTSRCGTRHGAARPALNRPCPSCSCRWAVGRAQSPRRRREAVRFPTAQTRAAIANASARYSPVESSKTMLSNSVIARKVCPHSSQRLVCAPRLVRQTLCAAPISTSHSVTAGTARPRSPPRAAPAPVGSPRFHTARWIAEGVRGASVRSRT